MRIVGVLLAAGAGTRFGGGKLLASLRDSSDDVAAGTPLGVAACRHVVAALPEALAVVRPGDDTLTEALTREGARVVVCARADEGMGASLACGVAAAADADGWVVALADMPWIRPETMRSVAAALADGADLVAPFAGGQRGHPVGFSRTHRAALLALRGDEGARDIVKRYGASLVRIDVDDTAILRDVDTPSDLARGGTQ
jgi:molybdenum cofactor cytidylyltransferase